MDTIITISGPARHGKSQAAESLKKILENNGRKVMLLNFADYLKLIAKNCFNYKGEDYKTDFEQRTLLQKIGTEIGRKYNEDFWVRIVADTIVAFQDEFHVTIIADARFPNECAILKDRYKVVNLKVLRRNFDNQLSAENKEHSSENSLKFYDFDHTIDSESIRELEEKLSVLVEKHLQKPIKEEMNKKNN